ncbi:MAG: response regulator transcription factor [Dehalococcoidia bacterium]
MQTTNTQETRTKVEQRTAHILADPDVWPPTFQASLEEKGFSVLVSQELNELFDRTHDASPHLLILAKRNARFAIRACRAMRGLRDAPTIVVIPSESDFVPVMDAGADDAITSSSDPVVFATRFRALLRRTQNWQSAQSGGIITIRELLVDLDKCEVILRGRHVSLTPTEFRILAVLGEKAGRVVDARTLLSSVHDHDYDDREAQNLVKVHIANLRRKLEDGRDDNPYVLCVRGFGYMLERREERREDDPILALLDATGTAKDAG